MTREETIWENAESVRGRIRAACAAAGRREEEVTLVAVSKTYGAEDVRAAARAGQRLFGENRVQEALGKIPMCPGNLEWHLIGHLQRNKARKAAQLFDVMFVSGGKVGLNLEIAPDQLCSFIQAQYADLTKNQPDK